METHARYLLIGVFSLVVTIGLILFVLWLGKLQLDREYQYYDVRFEESVAGLSVGSIVQYQGIQVGEVRRLDLDPTDPRVVRAHVRVSAGTPVKTDTRAKLSYTGLTGVAVIELFGGSPEAQRLVDASEGAVPVILSEPSVLSKLMSEGSGAVLTAQEVLARVSRVLSDENLQRASDLIDNLAQVSSEVRDDYPKLRESLQGMQALEQRLRSAAERADALLARIDAGMAGQAPGEDLFTESRATLDEVADAARAVELAAGDIGRTAQTLDLAARDDLAVLLAELQRSAAQLEQVTRRLQDDPAGWLLGRDGLPRYDPGAAKGDRQ